MLRRPEPAVEVRSGSRRLNQSLLHIDGSVTAWLGVTLQGRDSRPLGFIHLFDQTRDRFSESDWSILVQLAEMTAVALDNVQLYERQHRTAVTLQRALLPGRFSMDPRLRVATRYMPGEAGLNVGGDWYDLVNLEARKIALAMGDVAGRGAKAAAVMGRVRTAWRAYALRDEPPETVMESLNTLIQELDPDHFSTLVHVVIDLDRSDMKIVNAGHPPPLLIAPDGEARFLRQALSVPMGTLTSADYHPEAVALGAGSTVLLYTDGLIERADIALDERLRLLQQAAHGRVTDVEVLCDRILERMLPEEAADDVALVALKLDPAAH
jgi:serine phosphatase RsbU (regulator of sigma subunit)